MQRKHVLAATLAAVLLLPAIASARGNGPTPADILHNPRLLARYLKLTPEQVTQTTAFAKTLADTLRPLHEQEKALRDQLAAELAKTNPDACTVGGFVVQIKGIAGQQAAALRTFDTAFSAILTPEQLAKYNALKEAAHIGDST
jgi:Spy/CpxP family protein refolding chaperone